MLFFRHFSFFSKFFFLSFCLFRFFVQYFKKFLIVFFFQSKSYIGRQDLQVYTHTHTHPQEQKVSTKVSSTVPLNHHSNNNLDYCCQREKHKKEIGKLSCFAKRGDTYFSCPISTEKFLQRKTSKFNVCEKRRRRQKKDWKKENFPVFTRQNWA